MYLARFTLIRSHPPLQPEAELLHDALWVHLGCGHGVEHITVTAIPAGIDLVLFLRHDIPDPIAYARRLLDAAARHCPLLHPWTASAPDPTPPAPPPTQPPTT